MVLGKVAGGRNDWFFSRVTFCPLSKTGKNAKTFWLPLVFNPSSFPSSSSTSSPTTTHLPSTTYITYIYTAHPPCLSSISVFSYNTFPFFSDSYYLPFTQPFQGIFCHIFGFPYLESIKVFPSYSWASALICIKHSYLLYSLATCLCTTLVLLILTQHYCCSL